MIFCSAKGSIVLIVAACKQSILFTERPVVGGRKLIQGKLIVHGSKGSRVGLQQANLVFYQLQGLLLVFPFPLSLFS